MKYLLIIYSVILLAAGKNSMLHIHQHNDVNTHKHQKHECIECLSIDNNNYVNYNNVELFFELIATSFYSKNLPVLFLDKCSSHPSRAPPAT